MAFKVKDTVKLNSGGPRMTVKKIEGDKITCVWYSQKQEKYLEKVFDAALLDYPSPPPRVGGDRGLGGY